MAEIRDTSLARVFYAGTTSESGLPRMQMAVEKPQHAASTFEDAVDQMRTAVTAFFNGDIGPWTRICSHADDASLWGGWERGWSQLEPRYAWAAARFASAEVCIEDIAEYVNRDLGYTVWIERSQARLRGIEGASPLVLRVTHVYRNENGTWRMVHRHADPVVAIQGTEVGMHDPALT